MPVEVLLDPLKDVIAGEVGEYALVEVGAAASAEVIHEVDVHWNLPNAGERFRWAETLQGQVLVRKTSGRKINVQIRKYFDFENSLFPLFPFSFLSYNFLSKIMD